MRTPALKQGEVPPGTGPPTLTPAFPTPSLQRHEEEACGGQPASLVSIQQQDGRTRHHGETQSQETVQDTDGSRDGLKSPGFTLSLLRGGWAALSRRVRRDR